ncbi:TraB/GumN family protein [Paenibacillus sp. PR3]|uniref:TraB/GumN family protein n=1 Tax=Paenibacillus terricola TaxID=2763503 RepID=A0ABR8MX40_9BACL|nr:TraB/GumN family protein [Paenibacillus terricola]MBD3920543.1 TraB/GumN family protein [Paenibacillus terricola]
MKLKKLSSLLLALIVMLSVFSATSYAAAQPSTTVLLDGKPIQLGEGSAEPFVDNGTTFVPMRSLFETLSIDLSWNNTTKTVSGAKGDLSFSLQIGSKTATVNGEKVTLTTAARIVHNVTFVPLRFVGQSTGYNVSWAQATHTISLTSPVVQAAAQSKGFMWKVEKNGNTVYLLGTIHVADKATYPLRPELEAAFKSADYLGVEVDLTQYTQEQIGAILDDLGTYKDGTTLKDHVSADTYKGVTAILKGLGAPENTLDKYEPWVVSLTIPSLMISDAGYQAELGIDQYLMQQALKSSKPIVQLETAEQQYGLFDNLSADLQESLLVDAIKAYNDPSSGEDQNAVDALLNMWKTGDETTLLTLTNAQQNVDHEYYQAFIADRNKGMTNKIEGFLNSTEHKTYFVAVGSLHMIGDDGIVTQLTKDGYTVEKQ